MGGEIPSQRILCEISVFVSMNLHEAEMGGGRRIGTVRCVYKYIYIFGCADIEKVR